MKTIVCFGDSNTHGYNPVDGGRLPYEKRWTGILQELMKENWRVIEEGLNGRTINADDEAEPYKNGMSYLKACLSSHRDVDLVIVMLGTNDLKTRYQRSVETVAADMRMMVRTMKEHLALKQKTKAQILLVAPIHMGEKVEEGPFKEEFDHDSHLSSLKFHEEYAKIAAEENCLYLNAAEYVDPSKLDDVHFDPQSHAVFAQILCWYIKAAYHES